MNAFPRQWVDVASSVPNDDQVVIICCPQALSSQAQTGRLHTLYLSLGTQSFGYVWVILDCSLMKPFQVALLQVMNQVMTLICMTLQILYKIRTKVHPCCLLSRAHCISCTTCYARLNG